MPARRIVAFRRFASEVILGALLVPGLWIFAPLRAQEMSDLKLEELCDLPAGAAPRRAHFLFEYRLDATGKVQGVQALYSSVEPDQERAVLATALSECIRQWGYRPPAPKQTADTALLVPFHRFAPAPKDGPMGVLPDGRELPAVWFDEMRDEKLRLATLLLQRVKPRLLTDAVYREAAGRGWLLRANVTEQSFEAARQALEFAERAFDAAFPAARPVPADMPLTVLLLQYEHEYTQVIAFENFLPMRFLSSGRYSSWDRTITMAMADLPAPLWTRNLAHEAAHHFIAQRLYAGKRPPMWVNEGIAAFIECLRAAPAGGADARAADAGADFDLAGLERGKIAVAPHVWTRPAEEYLKTLREAAADRKLASAAELTSRAFEDEFRSADPRRAYGQAWLLVHYLMNAEGGKHREGFRKWLAGAGSEGEGDTLAAALESPLERIDSALPAYLESFK
jgi:hypothetical protein